MSNKNNISSLANTSTPIRILIVEDQTLVRAAIKAILKPHKRFVILGEASNGRDAIELSKRLKPDVVLLDIELPDISGLQVAKRIFQIISTKILALTSQTDEFYLSQLSKLGVAGYLSKTCDPRELVEAIVSSQQNQTYLATDIANQITLDYLNNKQETPFDDLSQRQLEILIMLCHGENTASIAKKLYLSPKTINKHRQQLLKKLEVRNDIELAKLALQYGLIKL